MRGVKAKAMRREWRRTVQQKLDLGKLAGYAIEKIAFPSFRRARRHVVRRARENRLVKESPRPRRSASEIARLAQVRGLALARERRELLNDLPLHMRGDRDLRGTERNSNIERLRRVAALHRAAQVDWT